MYQFPEHVEEGGLMGYGVSAHWAARRVAEYVDRILNGATPVEMPIEQATTTMLALNLKTAQALGSPSRSPCYSEQIGSSSDELAAKLPNITLQPSGARVARPGR